MSEPTLTETPRPVATPPPPRRLVPPAFLAALAGLTLAFCIPLWEMVQLSLSESLYSHLPLIPLVSLYLVWIQRQSLQSVRPPQRVLAALLLASGAAVMGAYFVYGRPDAALLFHDALAWKLYGFLLLFVGTCAWFLGRDLLRALAFPLAFLVFMAPFPVAAHDAMERFLQYWSADAAYAMISSAGTPILRDGLIFHLPGIVLEVAPQCSGIRSSVALFITSLVAGHFFLRTPWKKAVLTFAVIPLAILRNGLRIFTIAQLCVYVSPDMVNSFIHHRGGPIFFAISLVPFFALLYGLYRSDRKKSRPAATSIPAP